MLTALITAAKESNIRFVYAISPGLDMTHSDEKENKILQEKLDQVKQ